MRTTIATLGVACLLAVCLTGTASAQSYSRAVKQFCAADYHKYCGEYGLETAALRVCMDKNGTQPIQGLRQCPSRLRRSEPGRSEPAQEGRPLRPSRVANAEPCSRAR